jgi:hypothetical protein
MIVPITNTQLIAMILITNPIIVNPNAYSAFAFYDQITNRVQKMTTILSSTSFRTDTIFDTLVLNGLIIKNHRNMATIDVINPIIETFGFVLTMTNVPAYQIHQKKYTEVN